MYGTEVKPGKWNGMVREVILGVGLKYGTAWWERL